VVPGSCLLFTFEKHGHMAIKMKGKLIASDQFKEKGDI